MPKALIPIIDELDRLKRDVKQLQSTLENDADPNIQLIAEGHYDLICKLEDALIAENDEEKLLIRVPSLEKEVKILKKIIEEMTD